MKYIFAAILFFLIGAFVQNSKTWADEKNSISDKASRPTISIQAKIEVAAGIPVRLKDLGNVDFIGPEQARQVLETVIFEALDDRRTKQIKSSEMIRILKDKVGEISDARWTYFIPDVVTVTAKKNLINESALRREIIWTLNEKCKDCSQIAIKDLKVPRVTSAEAMEGWQLETDQLNLAGSFLLPLQVILPAGRETLWVTGSIRAKKKGPIATRQILLGQRIVDADIRIDDIDVTFAKDGVPTREEIVGQALSKNISIGQPIYKSDIKKELAVQRGQVITAVLGNEVFEVTTQVTAEEQGYVGDVIKIKAQEGKKTLSGQITDKGVVKIK